VEIDLEDIHRSYDMGEESLPALRGVSLTVKGGEYVALTGASGSGKSTLMHVIGCLDRPTAGRYRLSGRAVNDLDDDALSALRNHCFGFVFQAFYLIPELDLCENVELPLVYRGMDRAERREEARKALDTVGLGARVEHNPTQLSGGERQRVAIARAIVGRPEILLADEPTGNLDSRTGSQVTELLEGLLEHGTTLMVVTHDSELAARASRVLRMRDGRLET
jgi:putative ABC transport system ATP-binding protein